MGGASETRDGEADTVHAVDELSRRLPIALRPLAQVAYNYWWAWSPPAAGLWEAIDPTRWERCGRNPVRLLQEVSQVRLEELAGDGPFLGRLGTVAREFQQHMTIRGDGAPGASVPIAYLSAEFGVHSSLPFYAGGLGVLAGDFLKAASDDEIDVVGVSLFYSQGSFHQRLDISGWQHEYWLATDSDRLPAVLVSDSGGGPLTVQLSVRGHDVRLQIWRVNVGRTRLYLLDSDRAENSLADRWITSRLYVGDRETRLAQYAVLGIGGVRALRAMGIEPRAFHLNEGHAALALLELIGERVRAGVSPEDAMAATHDITVFTTHTPVAAGNETFSDGELAAVLPHLQERAELDWQQVMSLARVHPEDGTERFGLTPLALRLTSRANGVSRRHGQVAREMWRQIWPGQLADAVPIDHVTNGVHLPSWMGIEMQALFDEYLPGWRTASAEDQVWDNINRIPDGQLWEVRCRQRARLVRQVRERSIVERLGRGESLAYAEAAVRVWDEDTLTLGFARRIATYKRLYLLTANPERALRLLDGPQHLQIAIAGRAHPQDDGAKQTVQRLFALNDTPVVGEHAVFLEQHDMELAAQLVQGCDLWLNLPRPPQEASGTSGMKSAINGGLQLSVLDGWWAEAHDGRNGWAIQSDASLSPEDQDARDAAAFFDVLELDAVPLFYARGDDGVPTEWVRRMKHSLRSLTPRFSAIRMVREYAARYPGGHPHRPR